MKNSKVSCFGAGFVGLPTMSVLALSNKDKKFVVYDIDSKKIDMCKQGIMPIFEPNLQQTVAQVINKNLFFTDDIAEALQNTDVAFLALPTPTKLFGQEKGKAYDLSYTESAIRKIVEYYNEHLMKKSIILVEKSTVPIGTARMITDIIDSNSIPEQAEKYIIVSNPEFLAQGSAIKDFSSPDRVVIGSKPGSNITELISLYGFVNPEKIIQTNQFSSELSKMVANCFLAQRVSSINSIAMLCEETEADVNEIKKCISADTRIGDKFLNSSVGFGGSCFKKDMLALIYLAQTKGLKQVANYWKAVIDMNQYRKKNFFGSIFRALNYNLRNKKLAILGVAFKKDTSDPRQSPAVNICHYLLQQGALLQIYDPKTTLESFKKQMQYLDLWKQSFRDKIVQLHSPEEAIMKSHAILLLTQWDQFKTYDYSAFYHKMERPSYVFDGRNLLNEKTMKSIGFRYFRVGKKFNGEHDIYLH